VQQFVSQLSAGSATSESIVWEHGGAAAADHGHDQVDDDLLSKLFDKL
jgi:hypothetical protein